MHSVAVIPLALPHMTNLVGSGSRGHVEQGAVVVVAHKQDALCGDDPGQHLPWLPQKTDGPILNKDALGNAENAR